MSDLDEERLRERDHQEGAFAEEHDSGREGECDPAEDRCAPDSEAHDPFDSRHIPGTTDDVPTSLGEDVPDAADRRLVSPPDAEQQPRFGSPLPRGAVYEGETEGDIAPSRSRAMREPTAQAPRFPTPRSEARRAPWTPRTSPQPATRAHQLTGDLLDREDVEDIDSLAAADERDLWRGQAALIEEDVEDGYKLPGFSDAEAEAVMAAMGDDAEEANPEMPEGTSATGAGSPLAPPHGGFPEREE